MPDFQQSAFRATIIEAPTAAVISTRVSSDAEKVVVLLSHNDSTNFSNHTSKVYAETWGETAVELLRQAKVGSVGIFEGRWRTELAMIGQRKVFIASFRISRFTLEAGTAPLGSAPDLRNREASVQTHMEIDQTDD